MSRMIPRINGIPLPYYADELYAYTLDEVISDGFIYFDNGGEADVTGIPINNTTSVTVPSNVATQIIWKSISAANTGTNYICRLKEAI